MSNIVTIKPKSSSKKFFSNAVQYRSATSEGGETRDQQAGTFNGERFPNSRQLKRPKYSYGKRKWLLDGFDTNSKELNDLVKACKFRYPKGHPEEGKMINECDIFDMNDAFFTHKQLFIRMSEGEMKLDKDRPLDEIMLRALKSDVQYQVGANAKGIMSSRTKYVITDKQMDSNIKKEVRDKLLKINTLFSTSNYDKKLKIATAMNIVRGEEIDPDTLDDLLYKTITDNGDSKPLEEDKSYADLFILLAEGSNDSLENKSLINKAKKEGFLRYQRKEGYMLFGIRIAGKMSEVEEYFLDEKNQDIIARLEKAIDDAN